MRMPTERDLASDGRDLDGRMVQSYAEQPRQIRQFPGRKLIQINRCTTVSMHLPGGGLV
jgi:hypothetical protein